MAYTPTVWVPGVAPGISAANLNNLEDGVDDAHDAIDAHVGAGGAAHADVVAGTPGTSGFMTGPQASKLAGVEAGATADQSAAEILAAVKTVDGAGSGLDADLLDGQEAAAFAAAGHVGATGVAHGNATAGGVAGFMTAADKTKLDGIASGAIAIEAAIAPFSKAGPVSVTTGGHKLIFPWAVTIVSVRAMVGTAPTGANLIVDVHKDGVTIFSTQANRPTITAGNTDSGSWATPDVTALAADSYLTVDIDQVGSTIAGSDLVVVVRYTKP